MQLKIEYIPIDELKPYERNNKKHEEYDIDEIAKSIEKYGFNDPLGIWKDNIIIEGHGRLEACKKLGITEVPCVRLDHLTDKQRREYAIMHNKTSELAEYDFDNLKLELDDLDLSDFDIDFGIDDEQEQTEVIEDEVPEVDDEHSPITKLGDIWQLGRHRLMCGNSLDENNVLSFVGDNNIDCVMTDPPYDMEMGGGQGCFAESTKNIKKRIDNIIHFDVTKLSFLPRINTNAFYIFTSKNGIKDYLNIFNEFNYDILIWNKTNPTPFTHGSFLPCVEYMLYFSKKGRIWNNSLKPTSVYSKVYTSSKEVATKEAGGKVHPTVKPQQLLQDKLRISSNENGIVLDIFGGSGSSLVACEQLNRTCFMMELDPKYVQVIIQRYIAFKGTGDDVYRINADGTKTKYEDIT